MSDAELYQSVLSKLGQLPPKALAMLDVYLGRLMQQTSKQQPQGIAHLAGAWSDWDNQEFEDFLRTTKEIREDLFPERDLPL